MLYERWRQVAAALASEVALVDLAQGQQWTFLQLAAAAESHSNQEGRIAFPQGVTSEFILSILRAWKSGQVVCPLEPGQTPPGIPSLGLPDGIVHLKTTSASTGPPRLVAFKAEQLMADAENIVATMGLRPDWPNLGVISLAHSYGFSNLVLPLLLHGIPLTLVGSALPEGVKRAAAAQRWLTLAAVPALWRTWTQADSIPVNTRLAISAGASLPAALEQSIFAMRGLKVHNFYGSSECGGIAFDALAGPRTDDSCVGTPMRNVSVSVAEDGCLEVRGQAVGETYWPEPQPNLDNGVFHTSDLAEISYGMVYLRGRVSDQINIAGRKLSPEIIERVLATHPAVRECLVFGAPCQESGRGESVVACVAPKTALSADDLRQFLLLRLAAWQVPREWWFVDALGSNERGKLSRAEWRKRFLDRKSITP